MQNFTKKELSLIEKFNTPAKIQDFLNKIPFNFEDDGVETVKSPLRVLRTNSAHCMEGALLGACLLAKIGYQPYLVHLSATADDFDHVVVLFKEGKYWGSLSKTNHYVLRYREPIYKNVRELSMTYFHEYFLNNSGRKTLRGYSTPVSIRSFKKGWEVSPVDLWYIDHKLSGIRHFEMVPKYYLKKLRKADTIERKAGGFVDFMPKNKAKYTKIIGRIYQK